MPKPDVDDLKLLISKLVFPFYQVERKIPMRFEPGRYENDAEHSWSLALFASALAPAVDTSLDIGKISQFAIVHDLVEVFAGDTSNFAPAAEKAAKEDRERQALERIQHDFDAFPWIAATVTAYELQDSPEARYVKSVDKIILLLMDLIDEGLFYKENKIDIEQWRTQMQKHREKASRHAGAFAYYDEIWEQLLANPQFFHQS